MRRRINQNKLPGIALTLAIVVSIIWDSVELFDASERILRLRSASMPSNARVQALTHTPTEVDILGNALAIKNVYQIDDQQFLVIVLDGTTNRQAIHDPTHCFYSGGWTIDQTKSFPTAHGEGVELEIHKLNRETEVLFWYSDGNQQHASPFNYWMKSTFRRLTLGLSGGEQILIIVQKLSAPATTDWKTLFNALPVLNKI